MIFRFILCLVTFHFFLNPLYTQENILAEPVKRITQAMRSGSYYTQQVKAWSKIIQQSPENGNAWYQYYTAARYSNILNDGKKFDLEKIVAEVVAKIPNSFEANYLTYALKPWEPESYKYLEKAHSIEPENPITYQAFINRYTISEEKGKFEEFCIKHFDSPEHSPGWMSWNYNALVNLEPNAILITEGDNDTYPAWTLQAAKNFRTDVAVININLMINDDYRATVFRQLGVEAPDIQLGPGGVDTFKIANINQIAKHSGRPVYLGVSSSLKSHPSIKDDLHLIGLSLKLDKTSFDNLPILEKSYEQLFQLDYIRMAMQNDPSQESLDKFSRSYLPSMFKLYKHYKEKKEKNKANKLAELILLIGEKSESQEETQKVLEKYN